MKKIGLLVASLLSLQSKKRKWEAKYCDNILSSL